MLSDEELLDLSRSLAGALRSGLPASETFASLARARGFGRHTRKAAELVSGGSQLHEAFAAQGAYPGIFLALVKAGEDGGKLDEFLELYAGCLEVRLEFRRRVERMLIYPAAALGLSAALFLLAALKVSPLLLEPLLASGAKLPPQAFLMTSFAERLAASWPQVTVAAVAALLLLRWALGTWPGRALAALAGHWLPVFRYASQEGRLYYLYTILALLMKAGLRPGAMLEALARFAADDLITGRRVRLAAAAVSGGTGLAAALGPLMSEEDRAPLEIAEKAGRLDESLLARARLHRERHLDRLKKLASWFKLGAAAAAAAVCFALALAVAWPALSLLSGAAGQVPSAAPEGAGGAAAPADLRNSEFNEREAAKVTGLMEKGGTGGKNEKPRKRLRGKVEFGQPTPIGPLGR